MKHLFFRSIHLLLFAAIIAAGAPNAGYTITLTASQIQKIQQLSPAEKAALAKQFGVPTGGSRRTSPTPIQQQQPTTTPDQQTSTDHQSKQSKAAPTTPTIQDKPSAIETAVRERLRSLATNPTPKSLRNAWKKILRSTSKRKIDPNLHQYGYDLFAGSPTSFMPVTDIPVPPEYVLGPGDEIDVQLFGAKEDQFTLIVDRRGSVAVPGIGPVRLAGMSFAKAKATLIEAAGEKLIGVTAKITMGRLRSIRVFVLGDVNHPGSYMVSGLSTISNALFESGGVSKAGSMRHILLKRAGKAVAELDLYDFLLHGDSSKDLRLQPGDVVFVPPIGHVVAVAGAVTRPGIYEVKNNHSKNSVSDILALAGGTLATADVDHILIDRITDSGQNILKNEHLHAQNQGSTIRNGDIVVVYPLPDVRSNTVTLSGHVKRPGIFGYKQRMHLSDIIKSRDDLLPNTFLDYMIIQRTDPKTGELSFIRASLLNLFTHPNPTNNPELRPFDKLMVFSNTVMRQMDSVTMNGAVRHPGEFPLGRGMKVSDLIWAAGGPLENAYLKSAELTRYEIINGTKRKLEHMEIDLTKAFAGDPKQDLRLQPHDVLMLRQISNWRAQQSITLSGEFKFPGTYAIEEGETIEDVIKRAGGFTKDAYLPAAFFTRETVRKQQQKALTTYINKMEKEIAQTQGTLTSINDPGISADKQKGLEAAKAALARLKALKPEGRLAIAMDASGHLLGDATLHIADGDALYVPKRPDEVMVIGEVYNQTALLYQKGKNRDDYLELAGGPTNMGDEDRIYIIRANGTIDAGKGWSSNKKMYPGDIVVVPQKLEAFSLLDSTLDWSKVLMQIGVFTASMRTIGVL